MIGARGNVVATALLISAASVFFLQFSKKAPVYTCPPGCLVLNSLMLSPREKSILGKPLVELDRIGLSVSQEANTQKTEKTGPKKTAYTLKGAGVKGEVFSSNLGGGEVISSLLISPPWQLCFPDGSVVRDDIPSHTVEAVLARHGKVNADSGSIDYLDTTGIEINVTKVGSRLLLIWVGPAEVPTRSNSDPQAK